jgi:1-acyl-sn-glycerol-3-phosphate acyltransferase
MAFFRLLLGSTMLLAYALNAVFWALLIWILGIPLLFLIVVPSWARRYRRSSLLSSPPRGWTWCNAFLMRLSFQAIRTSGPSLPDKKGFYVLICNHQSWADILLVNHALRQSGLPIKYFLKRSLLWSLPVAGIGCWILGFPFLSRHTPQQIKKNPDLKYKDIETTRRTCQNLKQSPAVLVIFPEGTRYTDAKHKKQNAPNPYVLKAKAGGLATLLEEVQDKTTCLIDMRIHYEKSTSMWDFFCRRSGQIDVHHRLIPLEDFPLNYTNREERKAFHAWLKQCWTEKSEGLMADSARLKQEDHA